MMKGPPHSLANVRGVLLAYYTTSPVNYLPASVGWYHTPSPIHVWPPVGATPSQPDVRLAHRG